MNQGSTGVFRAARRMTHRLSGSGNGLVSSSPVALLCAVCLILGTLLSACTPKPQESTGSFPSYPAGSSVEGEVDKTLSNEAVTYYKAVFPIASLPSTPASSSPSTSSPGATSRTASSPVVTTTSPADPARSDPPPAGETEFRLADYGPRTVLPASLKKPRIYVIFTKPVVPLSALGATMSTSPVMKIEPAIEGVYRWYGSRMLGFDAAADRIPQRAYEVKISENLKALDGSPLSGPTGFSFATESLALLELLPGSLASLEGLRWGDYLDPSSLENVPPERAQDLLLRFNYPVDPAVTASFLTVESAGKKLKFTASRPPLPPEGQTYTGGIETWLRLRLSSNPPFESVVQVTLAPGARSDRNSLPSVAASTMEFRSLNPFWPVETSEYSWEFDDDSDGATPLFIEFSHPVEAKTLQGKITVQPDITVTATSMEARGSTVRLTGLPLKRGTSYTVRLNPGIADIYGRKLESPRELSFSLEPERPFARFSDSGTKILEASQPAKVAWRLRSIREGYFRIAAGNDPYAPSRTAGQKPFEVGNASKGGTASGIIDLAPWLPASGFGTVELDWTFLPLPSGKPGAQVSSIRNSLRVQVTDLAITLRYGYNRILCLVSRLSDGKPVPGARVTLLRDRTPERSAVSDSSGLARFDLAPGEYSRLFMVRAKDSYGGSYDRQTLRIRAVSGADSLEFAPEDSHDIWSGPVEAWISPHEAERPQQVVMFFTDRGIYRPGESLSFRGTDRDLVTGRYRVASGPYSVDLMPQSWEGEPLATIRGTLSPSGGFSGSFILPEGLESGSYSLRYRRDFLSAPDSLQSRDGGENGDSNGVREFFEIAYFERQLFQTRASATSPRVIAGDEVKVEFGASYLSGGDLGGAPWRGYWTTETRPFDFGPEWASFAFGPAFEGYRETLGEVSGILSPQGSASVTIKTGKSGKRGVPTSSKAASDTLTEGPRRFLPEKMTFSLMVEDDISGKASGNSSEVTVLPASFALGLKVAGSPGPWFPLAEAGKNARFELIALGPDGKPFPEKSARTVSVETHRIEWKLARQKGAASRVHDRYERVVTRLGTFDVRLPPVPVPAREKSPAGTGTGTETAVAPGGFEFTPPEQGEYLIRVSSKDAEGRVAMTELNLYATGTGYSRWKSDRSEAVELTPDRALYRPGDTARLLVRSPLPKGQYLVTVERESILEQKIVTLDGSTSTIELSVRESWLPVVYVTISSWTVRTGAASTVWGEPDLDKPRGIFGLAALAVDPDSRKIFLEIEPDRTEYAPGQRARVLIRAKDASGAPIAGAELSFMAADRGILDLINYHVPDPVAHFYAPWRFPLATAGGDSRALLMDPVTYELKDLQGGGGDDGKDGDGRERRDFRPAAAFIPFLYTDSQGKAVAEFEWPDSLTTWRMTAFASETARFGRAEREVEVRNPVIVKSLLPGTLRLRDTVQAGLLITNLESGDREVTVRFESGFLTKVGTGSASRTVKLASGESSRIEFELAAARAGTGELRYSIVSGTFRETLVASVTVQRPVTRETVTVAGRLGVKDTAVEEGIILPSGATMPGTLTVSLAASVLPSLKDAFAYLFTYPYGCMEQRISALEPYLLFGDKAEDRGLAAPAASWRDLVSSGLDYLARRQLSTGGFPSWPEGVETSRYVSLRAAELFLEAREAGFPLPAALDEGSLLAWIASPTAQAERSDWLDAYSLYILARHGFDVRRETSVRFSAGPERGLAPYMLAALAAARSGDEEGSRLAWSTIRERIVPGTRSMDFSPQSVSGTSWWGMPSSRSELLSLMLLLSIRQGDTQDLSDKITLSLLAEQRAGIWKSTSDTIWALRAFSSLIQKETEGSGGPARAAGPEPLGLGGEALESAGPDGSATDGVIPNGRAEDAGPISLPSRAYAEVSIAGQSLVSADFSSSLLHSGQFPLESGILGALPRGMTLPLRFAATPGAKAGTATSSGAASPEDTGAASSAGMYYSASMQYEIPEELALARDEGLGLFLEYSDRGGAKVKATELVAGTVYRVRVVLSSPRTRRLLAVRVPVPSGCIILDSRFVTTPVLPPPPENSAGDDQELYFKPRADIRDAEMRYFFDAMEAGVAEMEFVIRAVTPGTYPVPPAQAECMYEPEVFGRGPGGIVKILAASGAK